MLHALRGLLISVLSIDLILQPLNPGLELGPAMYEWRKGARELKAPQTDSDARIPCENDLEEVFEQWRLDNDRVKRKHTAGIGVDAVVASDNGMFESIGILGRFA